MSQERRHDRPRQVVECSQLIEVHALPFLHRDGRVALVHCGFVIGEGLGQ